MQKQGTNEFEGVFNFLCRSSLLDRDGAGRPSALPQADFETLQPSIQLSGPLLRDRLWFRLSHEVLSQEDPIDLLGQVVVTTTEQEINSDQLTWQVSPRNKLALQYQYDPLRVDNLGVSSSVPPASSRTFERGGPTYSLAWLAPVSARVLFDSIVAYQDHANDLFPTEPDAPQNCTFFRDIPVLNHVRCRNLTTNRTSGPYNQSSRDQRQRLTAKTQVTVQRPLWGQSHQLKLGLVVENERYFRNLDRSPVLDFEYTFSPLATSDQPTVNGSLAMWAPRASQSRATGNSWALYAQDQWKPRANLSVTLGLRIDSEEIDSRGLETLDPTAESDAYFALLAAGQVNTSSIRGVWTTYQDAQQLRADLAATLLLPEERANLGAILTQGGFWFKRRKPEDIHLVNRHLSPRLSLAWDPFGNGRTKVALAVGRYHDKIFLAVPLVDLEPPEVRNGFGAGLCRNGEPVALCAPGSNGFFTRGSTVSVDIPSVKFVDRDLRTPYQDELALSVEREIFAETSLRLGYVRRRFRDQLQDRDINHQPADHGRCDKIPTQLFGQLVEPHFVVSSDGEGQELTDLYTGETYVDTDPGPGDGRLDDCTGDTGFFFNSTWHIGPPSTYDAPDGRPDLYVQSPVWGEILLLGNTNRADYEAFVLELVRRQYRNWQMEASYTWSTARGDAEDFDLILSNDQNLREDERGFLDYDQRHVVKLNAIALTPWGFRWGGTVRWESGLPYSLLISRTVGFDSPPDFPFGRTNVLRPRLRYPTGRRNDQRNPSSWTFDMRLSREVELRRGTLLQLSAEVFNLLNDDTARLSYSLAGANTGTRRFGRRWQLGVKLNF